MKRKIDRTSENKSYISKYLMVTLVIAVAFAIISSVSFAFIQSNPTGIENKFQLKDVSVDLVETFEDGTYVKKDVNVLNDGEADVYVRIALVEQCEQDSSIVFNTKGTPYFAYYYNDVQSYNNTNWVEIDGYYYYKTTLKAGETTENLFDKALPTKSINTDKIYSLTVAMEAIQEKALTEAWGADVAAKIGGND